MIRLQVRVERESKPQPPHGYRELETITDWLQIEIEGKFDEEHFACHLEALDQTFKIDCWEQSNEAIADEICREFGVIPDDKQAVFEAVESCFFGAFPDPEAKEKPC